MLLIWVKLSPKWSRKDVPGTSNLFSSAQGVSKPDERYILPNGLGLNWISYLFWCPTPELCSPLHFLYEEHWALNITWHWPTPSLRVYNSLRMKQNFTSGRLSDKHWKMNWGNGLSLGCLKAASSHKIYVWHKKESNTNIYYVSGSKSSSYSQPERWHELFGWRVYWSVA